jgi:hypothetical protein
MKARKEEVQKKEMEQIRNEGSILKGKEEGMNKYTNQSEKERLRLYRAMKTSDTI